ncbi:hypothetical protein HPG69_010046, partial [Diceros bicornis minor]
MALCYLLSLLCTLAPLDIQWTQLQDCGLRGQALLFPCGLHASRPIFDHGLSAIFDMGIHKSLLEGPVPLRGPLLQGHNMLVFIFMLALHTGCGEPSLITQDEMGAFGAGCQPDLDIPGRQGHREVGNAFFVTTLLLLRLHWSYLAACYQLVKVCTVPYQRLAIALLVNFAQAATNLVTCSQVCKDLKNCLWTQVGHLPMHKRAPKPLGTLLHWHIWVFAQGRAMTGSLPESYFLEPQSLDSHRIQLLLSPPVFRLPDW